MVVEQFDSITERLESFQQLLMRQYPEQGSFLWLANGVRGRSVLDLACGTGFYTRHLHRLGATRLTGVDLHAGMIDTARRIEARDPLGIEYTVADAAALPDLGRFDVVTAVYLLNYAFDQDTLFNMASGIRRSLVRGGELLTITQNPDFDVAGPDLTRYGMSFDNERAFALGRFMDITALLDPPFTFTVAVTRRDLVERTLHEAGFTDVSWFDMLVPAAGIERFGSEFWADFLANPPMTMVRCRAA